MQSHVVMSSGPSRMRFAHISLVPKPRAVAAAFSSTESALQFLAQGPWVTPEVKVWIVSWHENAKSSSLSDARHELCCDVCSMR